MVLTNIVKQNYYYSQNKMPVVRSVQQAFCSVYNRPNIVGIATLKQFIFILIDRRKHNIGTLKSTTRNDRGWSGHTYTFKKKK